MLTNILAVIGALWLVAVVAAAIFVVSLWYARLTHQAELDQQARLAQEAADWDEPTREDVEWDYLMAAVDDTPIYSETAAHIAKWEAEAIEKEWREWGGVA